MANSPFSKDLGQAGQEFAPQVPNQGAGAALVGEANTNLVKAQTEQLQATQDAAKGKAAAAGATIFAKAVQGQAAAEIGSSLSNELKNIEKGLQLAQVPNSFTGQALADPSVRAAYNEFVSLKALGDQGYSSEAAIKMRAEAIIKKHINNSPAFAPEIRKLAKEQLGFDPTGSQLKELGGFGATAKQELTPAQQGINAGIKKYNENVGIALAANGGNEAAAHSYAAQQFQAEQQNKDMDTLLKTNQVNIMVGGNINAQVKQVLDHEISTSIGNSMNTIQSIMTAPGPDGKPIGSISPQDRQALKMTVDAQEAGVIKKFLDGAAATTSDADKSSFIALVHSRYEPLKSMIDNGDMEKLNNSLLNTVPKQYLLQVFQEAPELLKYYATAGGAGGGGGLVSIQQLVEISAKGAELNMGTIQKTNPAAYQVLTLKTKPELFSSFLRAQISFKDPNSPFDPKGDPGLKLIKDTTAQTVVQTSKDPIAVTNALNYIKEQGTPAALHVFAQPATHAAVINNPQVEKQFQNIYVSGLQLSQQGVANEIRTLQEKGLSVSSVDGKLIVNMPPDADVTGRMAQAKAVFENSSSYKTYLQVQKLTGQYQQTLNVGNVPQELERQNKETLSMVVGQSTNPKVENKASPEAPGSTISTPPSTTPKGTSEAPLQRISSASPEQLDTPIKIASTFLGTSETVNNKLLAATFKKALGKDINPAQVPWCAAFVNSVLGLSGAQGSGSLAARSLLKVGTPTNDPTKGDIVVLSRGSDPSKGHTGFFVGYTEDGDVKILGGNQDDSVSVKTFPRDAVLGFRKPPKGKALEQFAAVQL